MTFFKRPTACLCFQSEKMDSTIAIPAQMASRRRGRGGESKARDLAGEMALQEAAEEEEQEQA